MEAFGQAVATGDEAALKDMLGEKFRELIPPVGAEDRYRFLEGLGALACHPGGQRRSGSDRRRRRRLDAADPAREVGVALAVRHRGRGRGDARAPHRTQRARRAADAACDPRCAARLREPVARQRRPAHVREAADEHAGQARRAYWPTKAGEEPSPLGPALAAGRGADASRDGSTAITKVAHQAGPSRSRRRARLRRARQLLGGFAVLAWPARYGDTG